MSSAAEDNAFGREFLESIVGWIGEQMDPQDVFVESKLIAWARENGFVKESEV